MCWIRRENELCRVFRASGFVLDIFSLISNPRHLELEENDKLSKRTTSPLLTLSSPQSLAHPSQSFTSIFSGSSTPFPGGGAVTSHLPMHNVPAAPLAFSSLRCLSTGCSTTSTQTITLTISFSRNRGRDPWRRECSVTSMFSEICHRGKWETESFPTAVGGNSEGFEVVVLSESMDSLSSSWGKVPSIDTQNHSKSAPLRACASTHGKNT